MCRWLVYQGEATFIEKFVTRPQNSLIYQSQHASEAKTEINGDGFGLGWYSELETPGLYREILPAWSDCNLKNICQQVRSSLFFSHVRASTGTSTSRNNCHPFVHKKWMFMHNGQIDNFCQVRRETENLIDDSLYNFRVGTTDSEAIFFAILSELEANLRSGIIDDHDAITATKNALMKIKHIMQENNCGPLRFTSAITDGETVYAFRFSTDNLAPSLYSYQSENGIVIASEPFDSERKRWQMIPENSVAVLRDNALSIHEFSLAA